VWSWQLAAAHAVAASTRAAEGRKEAESTEEGERRENSTVKIAHIASLCLRSVSFEAHCSSAAALPPALHTQWVCLCVEHPVLQAEG
jgi:hypothetical protein